MTDRPGDPLPEEITLSIGEATIVLFALDAAIETAEDEARRAALEAAARIIVEKLLPDLPDL